MSSPRQVIPGDTSFVSRRCFDRLFLLRPDDYVTKVFLYCLGYAAGMCNILIHGFVAMSNHFHLLLTDPDGRLPEFMERFDSLVARALNAHWGRWESFFAPGSYSAVRLQTFEDCMSKLVYILTNPVLAGLTDHARRWTGATSVRWGYGESRTFSRPDGGFFRSSSALPAEVTLRLAPLPGFEARAAELDELVRERVIGRETEIRAQFAAEGRPFKGMDEVLRCDPEDRPRTREPRRRMNPRVAGADPDVRLAAIAGLTSFRRDYRRARQEYLGGNRAVVFPAGTWLMRVRFGVTCAPTPCVAVQPPAPS